MKSLLNDKNDVYFQEKYPIFFKNKLQKKDGINCYYTNAIDNALKHNQVEAIEVVLKYIIKYQNNFVSSYLLFRSMPKLIEKGIKIVDLISSKIFNVQFDFDSWLGNHNDD